MGAETRSSVATEAEAGAAPAVLAVGRNADQEPGQRPEQGLYPGEPETCRRSLRPFLRNLAFTWRCSWRSSRSTGSRNGPSRAARSRCW